MIEYVNQLLKHWALEHSVDRSSHDLGYRSTWIKELSGQKSSGRVTARGTATRPTQARAGVGKVAERVDLAVSRLPEHLKLVVDLHYRDSSMTSDEKARYLGCSVNTVYKHIHKSHELLSVDLPDSYARWRDTYPHCG